MDTDVLSPTPPPAGDRERSAVFHLLGLLPLDEVAALEERLVYEAGELRTPQAVVLLAEHPPLITIGREGSPLDVRGDEEWRRQGYEIRLQNRGGGALVHAPGQLAVHAVVPLERFGLTVGGYLDRLQTALEGVVDDLHVARVQRPGSPGRQPDRRGVWCRGGQAAFFGVSVKYGVAYRGLFINVDLPRRLIRYAAGDPHGRSSADRTEPTTLCAESRRPIRMTAVRQRVVERLSTALGCGRYHVVTGHPRLARTYVSAEGIPRVG
jgi:lipoate-protein ligase B